jgi:hypothetical protein
MAYLDFLSAEGAKQKHAKTAEEYQQPKSFDCSFLRFLRAFILRFLRLTDEHASITCTSAIMRNKIWLFDASGKTKTTNGRN